jgi:heme A synthase
MFLWALRAYPKRHLVRLGASLSMILITTEALVGAGLVLFEWVAHDASVGRAVSIVIHLINTFLLLAALSLNAWWASGGKPFNLRGNWLSTWLFLIGIFGTMVIGASGALTALGDTLFPVNSFVEGITQDFSPTAHFLLRLRFLHPTIAVIVGIYLLVFSGYIRMRKPTQLTQYLAYALSLFLLVQLAAGLINVLLLAPLWMQIVHLLLADGVWIILIILTASSMAEEENIILHLDSSEKIQGLTNQ